MNYLFNQVGLFEINHPLFFKRDLTTRAAAYNKIQETKAYNTTFWIAQIDSFHVAEKKPDLGCYICLAQLGRHLT